MKIYRSIVLLSLIFCVITAYGSNSFHSYTLGINGEYSLCSPNITRVNCYFNWYDTPIDPLEIEIQAFSIAFIKVSKEIRGSYCNFILPAIAGISFLYGNDERFFGLGLAGILFQAPIVLGNFKIHLPIKKDVLSFYVGETTDYYLSLKNPVYTESRGGIKLVIGPVELNAAICKPWINGPIKKEDYYYTFSVGVYTSRKQMEKNRRGKWPEKLTFNGF